MQVLFGDPKFIPGDILSNLTDMISALGDSGLIDFSEQSSHASALKLPDRLKSPQPNDLAVEVALLEHRVGPLGCLNRGLVAPLDEQVGGADVYVIVATASFQLEQRRWSGQVRERKRVQPEQPASFVVLIRRRCLVAYAKCPRLCEVWVCGALRQERNQRNNKNETFEAHGLPVHLVRSLPGPVVGCSGNDLGNPALSVSVIRSAALVHGPSISAVGPIVGVPDAAVWGTAY